MRNSIRFKMTSILILIVGWVIVFTWFLNNTFSEKYYVSSEKAINRLLMSALAFIPSIDTLMAIR